METKKYSLKSMQNMWVVFISSRALRVTSPLAVAAAPSGPVMLGRVTVRFVSVLKPVT